MSILVRFGPPGEKRDHGSSSEDDAKRKRVETQFDTLDIGDDMPLVLTEVPKPTCGNPGRSDLSSSEFDTVFACGDFHGDYYIFQACMVMTGCVRVVKEYELEWVQERRRVAIVLLGDLVDRKRLEPPMGGEFENEEHMILRMANRLAAQAGECESQLFRLVGNHEILQAQNMLAVSMYSTRMAQDNDGGVAGRLASFQQGSYREEISACSARAVLKIGQYLFVHGGINQEVIRHAGPVNVLDACNETLKEYMESKMSPGDYVETKKPHSGDFMPLLYGVTSRRGGRELHYGVLWDDDLSSDKVKEDGPRLDRILRDLNENIRSEEPVTTLVVAHFVQRNVKGADFTRFRVSKRDDRSEDLHVAKNGETDHAVNVKYGGRVWCIDIGQSRAFGAVERPSIMVIDTKSNDIVIRRWRGVAAGNKSFIEVAGGRV